MKHSSIAPLFKKSARQLGIKLVIEPRFGFAGQIILKNGNKRYFRGSNFDLNTLGATEIVRDKDWATFFLKNMGYRTIPGDAFFSPSWCRTIGSTRGIDAAYAYAQKLGFPVFLKPNSLSQGMGVVKVFTRQEFMQAARHICSQDRVFLVQRAIAGRDYRVVVLDGEVMLVYERIPLSVTGDGRSTVLQLLTKKQLHFDAIGRAAIQIDDFRVTNCLRRQKYTRSTVLPKSITVTLLDNSNLSCGGDAQDINGPIHPAFQKLCLDIARDMGLRFCGIDLMIQGDITHAIDKYHIIEINASPGIANYASVGTKQKKTLETIYRKVFEAIIK